MLRQTLQRLRFISKVVTGQRQDALDLLESDHIRVEMLFFQLKASRNPKRRAEIFSRIKSELTLHARIEEQLLYPLCEKIPAFKDLIRDSYEDHKEVKALLREISNISNLTTQKANAKINELVQGVEEHVSEEENELFPEMRHVFHKDQLDELRAEIQSMKRESEKRGVKQKKITRKAA